MFTIISTCKGGGYRYCRTDPPHPNANAKGLYPLHRVLVENRIGRLLRRDEHVHHRDEDKSNDSPSNLEVLSVAEHARIHAIERAAEPMGFTCVCGKQFSLLPSRARKRMKARKSKTLLCSRSCGTRYSGIR